MQQTQFFDFLAGSSKYSDPGAVRRLNLRHSFIIGPFAKDIQGARVLDLASHDGRWPYAFAGAGAKEVVGIEGRAELVNQFADYPETPFKQNVHLNVGDIYEFLRLLVSRNERFDVVGVLGIFYHIMDHYGLLTLIHRLGPKLIIVDSEFMTAPWAHIAVNSENTAKELNSTAHFESQSMAPVGIPSRSALEKMATSLNYKTDWLDWDSVPKGERKGVREDYYREGPKRRFTCSLRPQ